MIKVGVIGIGNCGGQIGLLAAEELNADVVVLNTSDQDLEKVKSEKVISFLLGDKKGAGQDRTAAKTALKDSIREVIEDDTFQTFVQSSELIFIAGSTGGGTGSGIAPILYSFVDQMSDATCILIGVLPTLGEDRGIQVNTLNYLNELYNTLDGARYILHDNNKLSNLSSVKMMEAINKDCIQDIRLLSGFYNTATQYASMDDKDIFTMLNPSGGIITASLLNISEKDLDTSSIETLIVDELKNNTHCELDRDGAVMNTGIITSLSKKLNDTFNMNIPEIMSFVGAASGTGFKHIYINDEDGMPNRAFFIATGLSPVNDRITKINERIRELDEATQNKSEASALNDSILTTNVGIKDKEKKDLDIANTFKMFGV